MAHDYLKPLLLATLITLSGFSYADAELPLSTESTEVTEAILESNSSELPPEVAVFLENQDDLWARVRRGYGIPDLNNDLVAKQLDWYSARPEYILRISDRASLYLYHVVEELEKRGMPTELALLPFIESAFNPQAMSTAKASGMWQFMPATGRDFNLKQNMFHDERRGVLDSTDAALTYLEKLHGMFGDWQLALAAYNWGEGSVQRAIRKQEAAGLPVDYNSMAYLMPKETQNYVPKLQAVKNIISHPEQFNIELPQVENEPYFVAIERTGDIDVHVAAQLAELSVDEFKMLNPQFNRPIIIGDADTKILLPADNLEIFQNNLTNWKGPLSKWTTYTVRSNERVESIAQRVGAPVSIIKEVNHIPANMLVKAGSTLLVPKTAHTGHSDIAQHVVDNASLVFTSERLTKKITVTAGKKDSLASIAKRYRVSVAQIKQWNKLKSNSVKSGQKLQLEVVVASVKPRTKAASRTAAKSKSASKRSNVRVAKNTTAKKSTGKATLVSKQTKKTTVAQFKKQSSY
jgi:membrane-bound lytic murein transglycosylase D